MIEAFNSANTTEKGVNMAIPLTMVEKKRTRQSVTSIHVVLIDSSNIAAELDDIYFSRLLPPFGTT